MKNSNNFCSKKIFNHPKSKNDSLDLAQQVLTSRRKKLQLTDPIPISNPHDLFIQ